MEFVLHGYIAMAINDSQTAYLKHSDSTVQHSPFEPGNSDLGQRAIQWEKK